MFCARKAGARSTPAHKTCGLPAASRLRIDWQQYRRLSSPARKTEICDDGPNNADNVYGGCTTQCTLGPYCGDRNVDADFGEECDDGINLSSYGQTNGCAPGCRKVPFCGDGKVDSLYGERCDDGDRNGTGATMCDSNCKLVIP